MKISILRHREILLCCIALVVIGISVGGCSQQPDKPEEIEKVTIGATTQEVSTLIWIADDQEYFAQNGLDVTVRGYDTGIETIDALFAGEVDFADTVDFVVSGLGLERDDFRVLASIDTARINYIIARKDRGILAPSDLKGKRIGLKQGSSSEFYIGKFLNFNGLSLQDVELVYSHPPEMPDMIARGEIDATITWHPHNYHIQNRLGENAAIWSTQVDQDVYWVILGMEEFIEANPETVERLLEALVQAEEFTGKHQAEAKEIIARRVNLDPLYMESVWEDFDFEVTLPQAFLLTVEDEARWRISTGLTDKTEVPNYLNSIYLEGLEAVKPEAVTIIR